MFLVDLELNCFAILFGYSPNHREEQDIGSTLTELSRRCAPHPVFMAIGAPEKSLLRLDHCYQSAQQALQFKFYDPDYAGVISYASIQDRRFQYHYDPIPLVDHVMEALTLLNTARYHEAITAEAKRFRAMPLAPETVKKTLYHLMYRMKEYLEESLGGGMDLAATLQPRFSSLTEAVIHLNDAIALVLNFGDECIRLLSEDQALKSQGIVQEINEYIREHYRERLTIKKLAERFYLHPVYLGQLLMKKNGIGFNEWLHNLRIEEACRLLKENRYKNSEVAERVGYVNYSQFLRQFEKRMGLSPGEYKSRN